LLVTPGEVDGLSGLMKSLAQRYSQHFNRAHRRTGTLWEGRFRSSLVDSESYLFHCHRYIELNPVRAGMVTQPWEYDWSSYRANAGLDSSSLVVQHRLYQALGGTSEERAAAYRRLFAMPLADEDVDRIRASISGGLPLGSEAFLDSVESTLKRRARPGINGRPKKPVPADGKPGSVPGLVSGPAGAWR
jgi:putative transposase